MSLLSDRIQVARRFTRAVRVDTDLQSASALDGYVCSQSAVEALLLMARHRAATGHGAFTWTGPYGSGKSSLAVALAAIAAGDDAHAERLLKSVRPADREELERAFRATTKRWTMAPVTGRREEPEAVISAALSLAAKGRRPLARAKGEALHVWAARIAADPSHAGLVLIVDEMGKFLEGAARDTGDVYLFQELAETAARSHGRLIVVGILHQAFDEYAHRLAREARDEWLKVQGRFLDIPINLAGEEQLDLIGRAIEGKKPDTASSAVASVARALQSARFGDVYAIEQRLAACWPLHPIVASLLGPISRRRFGQNQRSLFGFLNSAEPSGFQGFLQETPDGDDAEFPVARLWDYLHANLEPAILASPDGHRWSTAMDAVERAEAKGATRAHLALLKAVALIDLFKDRSGLQATASVLKTVVEGAPYEALLEDLKRWSVVIYRGHLGAYAIYAGSDFDIEAAVDDARRAGVAVDYRRLAQRAALQPVLAKRHYEATGALRWFEIELAPLHEVEDRIRAYKPAPGAAGLFLLVISANAENKAQAKRALLRAVEAAGDRLIVCGWTRDSFMIREMAADLAALENVRANRPELEGDAIARREVDARVSRVAADLEDRLADAIDRVDWFLPPQAAEAINAKVTGPAGLSVLASRLADWRYPQAPRLPNELLNRTRPSSNAQAAVRALLRAMVDKAGQERLGLEGYRPESGLYMSVLEATGLHGPATVGGGAAFAAPAGEDPANLQPLWAATDEWLAARPDGANGAELYDLWRAPPFGLRDGLLPVLMMAYLLSRAGQSAVYLDGVFRPNLDALLVDRLLQDAGKVSLRKVELSEVDVAFIAEMARALSTECAPIAPTPLDVARALVAEVRALPNWTLRTTRLNVAAIKLRDRAKVSDDPNRLLMEDLPAVLGHKSGDLAGVALAKKAVAALQALKDAYPLMLDGLEDVLLSELRVRGRSEAALASMRRRAESVRNLTGNYRLDALATRLAQYGARTDDVEGLASLAANRPPRDWVDRDVDNARVELAALAQQFLKAELYVHLKDRQGGTVAMGIYISDPRYPEPRARELELTAGDREAAEALAARIGELLANEGASQEVALAALATLGLSLDGQGIDDLTERLQVVA